MRINDKVIIIVFYIIEIYLFWSDILFLILHWSELSLDEFLINSISFDKIIMITSFDNFSFLNDNDLISIPNSAQSMSYNNNSLLARLDQFIKCLLN